MNQTIKPEIEATFINIDKAEFRTRLQAAGAVLVQPETLMRRTVFDVDEHSFIRVRDEGNRITMSYKHCNSHTLSGMQESCLTVDNYDETITFIKACGFRPKAEQESYRETWRLHDTEIDIDTWPWIPTYVEIEGPTESHVITVAKLLDLNLSDAIYGSVDSVYQVYYDVTDHDINYCPEIKFTDAPAWLASKRRTKTQPSPRD